MNASGPGGDGVLRVAVSYPLLLRVLRELNPENPQQRAVADELISELPWALAARVELLQELDRHG